MKKIVRATNYLSVNDSPEVWGGKTVGLKRLQNLNLRVPSYYVFGIAKPPVEVDCSGVIENFEYAALLGIKFSVRSGAAVSMPGMLATKIPVELADVPAAVQEVYASWDSAEAKAYREAHGLEDLEGTACIVQIVPRGIQYSGVAFTADPQKSAEGQIFEPIIEAVEGLGEGLVQGEKKPVILPESWLEIVSSGLKTIFNNYGHSDVEWCAGGGSIYWLQHRALKFAPPAVEVPAHLKDGDVLISGQSIGTKVAVACAARDILKVRTFGPELYPRLLRARAVISKIGSLTCHAAIVAREQRYPALVGDYKPLLDIPPETTVVVDGTNGTVRLMREAVIIDLTKKTPPAASPRLPGVALFKRTKFCINDLCVLTYEAIEAEDKEKLAQYAELLSGYLYCAVLGEMRHLMRMSFVCDKRDWIRDEVENLGLETPYRKVNRTSFVAGQPEPKDAQEGLRVAGVAHAAFKCLHWASGFGGPKWAEVTAHLLRYLSGRMSDVLFLDGCFNLKHNSAPVFNKFLNVFINCETLNLQLNAKTYGGLQRMQEIFLQHIDRKPQEPRINEGPCEYWAVAESDEEWQEEEPEPEEEEEEEPDDDGLCHCEECEAKAKEAAIADEGEPANVEEEKPR